MQRVELVPLKGYTGGKGRSICQMAHLRENKNIPNNRGSKITYINDSLK